MGARICPVCGVNEVPPRCRKCDDCLGQPRQGLRVPTPPSGPEPHPGGDVILTCGHLKSGRIAVGTEVTCSLHRPPKRTRVRGPYNELEAG